MSVRITKSLWRYIKNATHRIPASTDLVGYADHTGTPMVTNINECTVAEFVAAGAGGTPAVDIGLRRITVTLTDGEIKGSPTASPIQIVAGIPNKILMVLQASFKKDFSAGAYTNVNPMAGYAYMSLGVQGGGGSENFIDQTSENWAAFTSFFTGAAAEQWLILGPYQSINGAADLITGRVAADLGPFGITGAIGADLVLEVENAAAGDFTGGNAANSLVIEVLYWIA